MASEVKKRVSRKRLIRLTEGVLSTVTDALLFTLALPVASLGTRPTSVGVSQTFEEAYGFLEHINYKTIKHALYRLHKRGLVKNIKAGFLEVEITQAGLKRIKEIVPSYKEKRSWDKMIYLVSYDISTKNNHNRRLLQDHLIKLGAVRLQDSLYLTPYNPKKILKEFVKENKVRGQILVSVLGKDSSIGDEDLPDLIKRVYQLEELNEHYQDFIHKYQNAKEVVSKAQVALEFLSNLKEDPQLPFELLPKDFSSDEAYLIFKRLTS